MPSVAQVNHEIIRWARTYNGLTVTELGDAIGVHKNQIAKWETGKTKPTFPQAIDLAKALHIPFGYLFLSEPPLLETPLPDLRTRKDRRLIKLSATLREVMYSALDRQEWYREYLAEYAETKLGFVGKFTIQDDPKKVASDIRTTLMISQDARDKLSTWDPHSPYLGFLSEKAESVGVLVMRSSIVGNDNRRPLSANEFQGFVITDDFVPVVFINGADFLSAQVFTLVHELAHIWIGKSGILTTDEAVVSSSKHQTVESFCNMVAVETLVPDSEFLAQWNVKAKAFYDLARHFRVSTLVILRRAYELDQITRGEFFSYLSRLKSERKPKKKGGRPHYYVNVAIRHSPTFMNSVIKDVRSGGTLLRDGARLLDIQLPTFAGFIEGGEF